MRKRANRTLGVAVALAVTTLIAAACSSDATTGPEEGAGATGAATPSEPSGELKVFSFEDSQIPEVMDPFEAQYPELEVRGAVFSSGDEAITKLEAGFQTDAVEVCVREIPRYVGADALMPLDTSRITNFDNLYPNLRDGMQQDGEYYVAAAQAGEAGLVWNPDEVPGGVSSYKQLFEDPALEGRVAMDGTPYYTIAIGALALGYEDPYNLTQEDLDTVRDYFIEHKDQFRTFFEGDSEFLQLYRSGEIVAAAAFPGYEDTLAKDGIKIEFAEAEEGVLTWICGMGISANAENVDAAYAWLNHFLSPELQKYFAEKWNYIASNPDTLSTLSTETIDRLRMDDTAWLDTAIPTQIADNYDAWLDTMRQIRAA